MSNEYYVGVVEDRGDPKRLGRVRVRVLGLHTEDKEMLPTNKLPWAHTLGSANNASVNGIGSSPTGAVEGSWVMVQYLDGDARQEPFVMGTLYGKPDKPANPLKGFSDPRGVYPKPEFITKEEDKTATTNEKQENTEPDTNQLAGTLTVDPAKTEDCYRFFVEESARRQQRGAILAKANDENPDVNEIPNANGVIQNTILQYIPLKQRIGNRDYTDMECLDTIVGNAGLQIDGLGLNQKADLANKLISAPETVAGVEEALGNYKKEYLDEFKDFVPNQQENFKEYKGFVSDQIDELKEANEKGFDSGVDKLAFFLDWFERTFHQDKSNLKDPYKDADEAAERVERGAEDVGRVTPRKKLNTPEMKREGRAEGIPIANTETTWSEPPVPYAAVYPFNRVYESESGNIVEIDDTKDSERIHVQHRMGSFIEFHPDGSIVHKNVGSGYVIIERDGFIYIQGSANITVGGDATLKVLGNADVEVEKNLNAKVHQNASVDIENNANIKIGNDANIDVDGTTNLRCDENVNVEANKVTVVALTSMRMETPSWKVLSDDVEFEVGKFNLKRKR